MGERRTDGTHTYEQQADGKWHLVDGPAAPGGRSVQSRAPDANAALDRALKEADLAAKLRAAAKTASETPAPLDPTLDALTGEAYLARIPKAQADQVRALSDGRLAFPAGAALRSPYWQTMLTHVSHYDPTFDAINYNARSKTRNDFTSGTSARNITSFNTALGHLGTLWEAAQGLHNRSIPAWNAIANAAAQATGDPAVTRFNQARHAVVDELERAFRGSGGTQAGVEEWKESINSSQSPEQLRAAIEQGVVLLQSRIDAIGTQYSAGMGKSTDPLKLLNPHAQAVFNALGPGGDGVIPPEPGKGGGDQRPVIGGPPPASGGGGGGGQGIDLSSTLPDIHGAPQVEAAGGASHQEIDNILGAEISTLIRAQRPASEIIALIRSKGGEVAPETARQINDALRYARSHPGDTGSYARVTRTVPNTAWEQISGSAPAAASVGASNALVGGWSDEIVGAAHAAIGGDYEQSRDAFNARKHLLSEAHPYANLAGNVVGGATSMLGGQAVLGRIPALVAAAPKLGKALPIAGDVAYGAFYGAGENNQDRLMGGFLGGLTGGAAGHVTRGVTGGLGRALAPTGGEMVPLYEQGVFPTLGQRLASKTGPFGLPVGKAINTAEQALQSVPLLGSLVARARQIPRNQFQLGAFNSALGEIGERLPAGTRPGTSPHAFAKPAFDKAYDAARSGMSFVPDAPYLSDLNGFKAALGNGVLDATQAKQVGDVIQNAVGSRLRAGAMAGDSYKAAAADLSAAADAWSRTDPLKANALRNYLAIFDSAARRNSHPGAVAALDAADRGYAKLVRIQDAAQARGGESGTFTPTQFDRSVQRNSGGVRSSEYNRGEAMMQDYAEAGRGLVDTLPNSGTTERLMTGQILGGGSMGGASALGIPMAALAKPGALALGSYAPGMNYLTTRALAPRSAVLPPAVANWLAIKGAQIEGRAPFVGRLAVPYFAADEAQ